MVVADVAVTGERRVDHAVDQQQPGTIQLRRRVESDISAAGSRARAPDRRGDHHRRARTLGAGDDIDRVDPLDPARRFLSLGDEVDRSRGRIDDRRRGDADLRFEVVAAVRARGTDVERPQRRGRRRVVGVEGVDGVVLGRDVDHVVDLRVGHRQTADVERLRIDLSVDGAREQQAELGGVDVGGRQLGLLQVRARASVVVSVGRDRVGRAAGRSTRAPASPRLPSPHRRFRPARRPRPTGAARAGAIRPRRERRRLRAAPALPRCHRCRRRPRTADRVAAVAVGRAAVRRRGPGAAGRRAHRHHRRERDGPGHLCGHHG